MTKAVTILAGSRERQTVRGKAARSKDSPTTKKVVETPRWRCDSPLYSPLACKQTTCIFSLERFFFFFSSHLQPMDLIITILPVVTKDLPISPRFMPYNFLSRCKFTLTTRQPMVEFYLLTFPRFPLRKKEHKSCFGKNRTHDFRTSRCAAYLLDHSGDELYFIQDGLRGIPRKGKCVVWVD